MMKPSVKLLLRLPAIVLAVLTLTACPSDGSDDYLTASTSQVTLVDGVGQLTISSNVSWSVTEIPTWLDCSPMTGQGDRVLRLTQKQANPSSIERSEMLVVKSSIANLQVSVTIVQPGTSPTPPTPGADAISLSATSLTLAAAQGAHSIIVTSSGAWTSAAPQYSSDASGWLTLSPTSGAAGTSNVTLTAQENTTTTARQATITYTCGTAKVTLSVTQQAAEQKPEAATLSVSTAAIGFSTSGAGSDQFTIESNTSWNVSANAAWLTLSPTSGNDNATITVTATDNTDKDARQAIITVSGKDVTDRTITVTQPGVGAHLILNHSSLNFSTSRSDKKTFGIDSNVQWIVTTSASWLTVSPTSGSGNATISVEVADNNDADPRTATITVSGEGITRTVSVQQSGNSLQVSPQELSFKWEGEEKSFTITSEGSWVVSGAPSWCNLSQTSGSGNATISVTAAANNSSSDRTATLTVKSGSISHSVTLTQNGQKVPQEGDQNLPDHSRSSK